MSQKYNPLLQYGFQEVTSGGGGGGGGSDAWSFNGTITDFAGQTYWSGSTINWQGNRASYNPIRIESNCTIKNMGFNINSLSSNASCVCYGALYKYDIATDTLNLVAAMPQEIQANTTTGVTGLNLVNFASNIDITPGLYVVRVISNVGAFQTNYNNLEQDTYGYYDSGTNNLGVITSFYELVSYDFGSTPTSINFSQITPSSSFFYQYSKSALFTLIQ